MSARQWKILKRKPAGMSAGEQAVEPKTLLRRPMQSSAADLDSQDDSEKSPEQIDEKVLIEYGSLLSSLSSLCEEAFMENENRVMEIIDHEKERLDSVFRTRQELLLRLLSNCINEYLPEAINTAMSSEFEEIFVDFEDAADKALKSASERAVSDAIPKAINASLENSKDELSKGTADALKNALSGTVVRQAFVGAFEELLLPSFEESTRTFLASFAKAITNEVEGKITKTLREGVADIEKETQALKSNLQEVTTTMQASSRGASTDSTPAGDKGPDVRAKVADLFQSDKFTEALKVSLSHGDKALISEVVMTIIEKSSDPERTSDGLSPSEMVYVMEALSICTSSATSRLKWLSDLSVLFVEAAQEASEENSEFSYPSDVLEEVVKNTMKISVDALPKDIGKAKKLVVHLLNSQVRMNKAS
mmetsp:Transcript_2074/g.6187  ORF Transcript_2074/g.6187 Transcript_2074/m.6187 type:complete len:422 (+) Transcript_2074:265-1530(+)|eukprot:CAMPEP_0198723350 /NCGR_PEP_ID=MMETSP1475-20131203/868_1 /TAXON_ID= ORGANISM="Unidentified sp., Strain CCMP1999" /NCGR_SAMPLE_ID=MMETSP1475 /ASSEMBLY_ACC=CAM_ASM_001111 /LENGTH=421 /DNA_ID=CAMNT_0044484443 /DNA_START=202 /DNA_END=1467 /DNA_ORIENTATION=-